MDDWKEKIIKEKLGGKKDWTDEERAELSHHLDKELEKHLASIEKSGQSATRPEDAWTEDNWKEKMSEHPLFAPYVADKGKTDIELKDSALSDGLAQLKFDPEHNSPVELAQNYKEDGVYNFKYKNYRIAITGFTEGLKQKCKDQELNAQLYNNRAAAHFHLENYRSAIKDCDEAVKLKPDYVKAIVRAAQSATKIASWDEVISWCDKGLQLNSTDETFLKIRTTAMKEKKKRERDSRKKLQTVKQKTVEEQHLLTRILSSGVRLGDTETKGSQSLDLSDLEPCHPSAQDDGEWLNSRAILCPNNEAVKEVNHIALQKFPGKEVVYKSTDMVLDKPKSEWHLYSDELLNSISAPGLPSHRLCLKKGAPIMLLMNFDQSNGHCIGSRYIIENLTQYLIDATLVTGPKAGERLFIPRIPAESSENLALPFRMKRIQFPVRLCFGMTATRAQGQTLQKGSRVHLNESVELIWPVMFMYPEFYETDLIQKFNENSCFYDHLEVMFGADVPPAPWDTDHSYKINNVCIFFENYLKHEICEVDPKISLKQVLQDIRFVVKGGTPAFIIVVKNNKFFKEFMERYKYISRL